MKATKKKTNRTPASRKKYTKKTNPGEMILAFASMGLLLTAIAYSYHITMFIKDTARIIGSWA